MQERVCTTCGKSLPLCAFARKAEGKFGRQPKCRECTSEYTRDRYQRKRSEILDNVHKTYRRNRDAYLSRQKALRARTMDRERARGAVRWALRRGDVTRPDHCSLCGRAGSVQAHHPDYSKPLDVQWLCRSCHLTIHGKERSNASRV